MTSMKRGHFPFILLIACAVAPGGVGGSGLGSKGMCQFGGFMRADEPALTYYQNKLIVGEIGQLRSFDPSTRRLVDLKVPAEASAITSAGTTTSRVYLGTNGGLFVSRDLNDWKLVGPLKGKPIGKISVINGDAWVGTAGELVHVHEDDVVKRYPLAVDQIVMISPVGGKIAFSAIKKGAAPSGYCEPFMVSEGLQILDPASGKSRVIPAPGRAQEQAVVQIAKGTVIFSDNYLSNKTYDFDPASLTLTASPTDTAPNFAKNWLSENEAHQGAERDLMDVTERLFAQENFLRYWRVWNDVLQWLRDRGEDARLMRMYIAAEPRNKEKMIQTLGHTDDAFAKKLLTLAVDRHEYFREELARIVDAHKGADYEALLIRMMEEAAPIEPESIGKNVAIPYPCASGQAADALLRRMGEKALPLVEKVAEAPTTNPIVQESVRHRLKNWSRSRGRAYKTPMQLRAEKSAGPEAVAMLDDKDAYVRFQAIQHLKATPNLVPLSKLVALLNDDKDVAPQAVMVITDSNDPGAADALLKVVNDPRVPIRAWAMIGLGKRGDKRAYSAMIAGLSDANADVRGAAARGLGSLKDPRAADALQRALTDTNWDVRNEATQALKAISKQ